MGEREGRKELVWCGLWWGLLVWFVVVWVYGCVCVANL